MDKQELDALKEKIIGVLNTIYDPEIPVPIYELGLIYRLDLQPQDDGVNVEIDFTLTAVGCPVGPMIMDEIRSKVKEVEGVKDVKVNLVFNPPWTPDRMSEKAKAYLGIA